MPLRTPAPLNKRKKPSKIITDLSHISQNEFEPEASEFDLGTKIRTPRDIMLEELSLQKNRGSKMFKMRQQRVEKFIYENNPDVFSTGALESLQKFVPSLGGSVGGQTINIGGHHVSKEYGHPYLGVIPVGGAAPVPPPKPGSRGVGAGGAGGAGSGGGDGGAGGLRGDSYGRGPGARGGKAGDSKTQLLVKTYISPWEKAMKGDENLLSTLKALMPGPIEFKDLPKFKCFNRAAMPFGGFEKANQLLKFQLPETQATKEEPEPPVIYQHDIGCRPSFNRTPIGWVGSSEPSSIHMESDTVPFDGETDDL